MVLTDKQKERKKQLEESGYEIVGSLINKKGKKTPYTLGAISKEGEVEIYYPSKNIPALKLSLDLEEALDKEGIPYNRIGIEDTKKYLNSQIKMIKGLAKKLSKS